MYLHPEQQLKKKERKKLRVNEQNRNEQKSSSLHGLNNIDSLGA
jgi:hypothetical protein